MSAPCRRSSLTETSLNRKEQGDRETADRFAHRFGEDGTVYEAQIRKEHILALFTGRNESEVIVDPRHLEQIMESPEPGFDMQMT